MAIRFEYEADGIDECAVEIEEYSAVIRGHWIPFQGYCLTVDRICGSARDAKPATGPEVIRARVKAKKGIGITLAIYVALHLLDDSPGGYEREGAL